MLCITINAKSIYITGKVLNSETNETLPGVSVIIKSTLIGTTTDINGNFLITGNVNDTYTLVFSYIGFKTKEIDFKEISSDNLDVKLEPSIVSLDEVVISTTKNDMTGFLQTTPVSLVSQRTIAEFATQDLSDIICRQPSVSLVGEGYHRAVSIRGLARKRVVVMIDGERISSERNVGPPGTFINPFNVKKIEILRGPYSTLYGSDAIGGVMNIITEDYSDPVSNNYVGGELNANYQSIRNGYNINLMLNSQISNKLFLHLSVGKRAAESYKDGEGEEVMGTNFSEKSLTAKVLYLINSHHKIELSGLLSEADSIGKPAFSDSLNALHPEDNHYKAGVNYEWSNISSWFTKMSVKASVHHHKINARIYNYTSTIYGRVINQQKNLFNDDYVYQQDFSFIVIPKIKVLTGIDFYQRNGIHIDENKRAYTYEPENPGFHLGELVYEGPIDTIINDSYQRSLGIFAQINYAMSQRILLTGGLRWNDFKTVANLTNTTNVPPYDYSKNTHTRETKQNSAFSGNVGAVIKVGESFTFTTNIGQAFRVPSTKELFVNTMTPGGMNFCNPDLVPERSFNIDFGVRYTDKKKNSIVISFFRNEIKDMIILDWDSTHASGTFQNIDALLYGGELVVNYNLFRHLNVNGNASFVIGHDNKGEVLMDIPPLQINCSVSYDILPENLFVSAVGRYNAKQDEVAVGDVPTDEFVVFDLILGLNINKYFSFNASVTNLFNSTYREHYQFYWVRQQGRSFNAGLKISF